MLLSQTIYPKRIFDPKNPEDLRVFHRFLTNYSWDGPCPFHLEWPYEEIPAMIKDKILHQHIGDLIKAAKKKP